MSQAGGHWGVGRVGAGTGALRTPERMTYPVGLSEPQRMAREHLEVKYQEESSGHVQRKHESLDSLIPRNLPSPHLDPPRMGGSWLGAKMIRGSGSGLPMWEGVGSRAAPRGLQLLLLTE